ncbi:SRPBCC family protein [Streptomyces sp. NPDC048297]|uniref:SRPBCC family protein n=1 Tax=Streptomyces sp. NPDC048297 TaxID=3365531 RepID=UPI00370FA47B
MPLFTLERIVPLPPGEAWRRLTDWPRHGDVVPLTRITVLTPGPAGAGTRFTARTGIGPLGFEDPMEVTVWLPPDDDEPGLCRLEKQGRVVLGWAEIEVRPAPGGHSRVVWREDLRVRSLPRFLDGLVEVAARRMFGRAVNRLLRRRP